MSEVLAARGAGLPDTVLPDTVRDAVLARAARLSAGGRSLLDASPCCLRADRWLLERVARDDLPSLEECLTSGMLQSEGLAGIEYCRDHDLDSWLLYMSGWKARAELTCATRTLRAISSRSRLRTMSGSPR